jgi:hypothetical protein
MYRLMLFIYEYVFIVLLYIIKQKYDNVLKFINFKKFVKFIKLTNKNLNYQNFSLAFVSTYKSVCLADFGGIFV